MTNSSPRSAPRRPLPRARADEGAGPRASAPHRDRGCRFTLLNPSRSMKSTDSGRPYRTARSPRSSASRRLARVVQPRGRRSARALGLLQQTAWSRARAITPSSDAAAAAARMPASRLRARPRSRPTSAIGCLPAAERDRHHGRGRRGRDPRASARLARTARAVPSSPTRQRPNSTGSSPCARPCACSSVSCPVPSSASSAHASSGIHLRRGRRAPARSGRDPCRRTPHARSPRALRAGQSCAQGRPRSEALAQVERPPARATRNLVGDTPVIPAKFLSSQQI